MRNHFCEFTTKNTRLKTHSTETEPTLDLAGIAVNAPK